MPGVNTPGLYGLEQSALAGRLREAVVKNRSVWGAEESTEHSVRALAFPEGAEKPWEAN